MVRWVARCVAVLHDAFPATIDYPTAREARVLRDLGYEVHVVELGPRSSTRWEGVQRWSEPTRAGVVRRLARLRPQLCMAEGATWMLLGLPFAQHTWTRVTGVSVQPLKRRAQQRLLPRARHVSFLNPHDEQQFALPPGKVVDLAHAVDIAFWSDAPERDAEFWQRRGLTVPEGPVLCYAAQLMRRKRQRELVDWLGPLLQDRPDVRLVLAGGTVEPDEEAAARASAVRQGIEGQVVFIGPLSPREEVRQLYAWSTVHVINTAAEMECMVLYESLAGGTPTLISDIPELTSAFPALLKHADGEQLRANVTALLDDPALRDAQVRSARARLPWADNTTHDRNLEEVAVALLGRP